MSSGTTKRRARGLTVAVTGPTGTFGSGLVPLLEADDRVRRVVGIARRPFDPAEHGWSKMTYRRGDVSDRDALAETFAGADVVAHLAFLIAGTDSPETLRTVNVEGTLNAFRAAAAAGARRFVYASSVAAYGFHPDTPALIREDWPVRPSRLFYAQEKAELERRLQAEAAGSPTELYLLRPSLVAGPNAVGGKLHLLFGAERFLPAVPHRLPFRLPVLAPEVPIQLVHEADVGQALLRCVLGEGPPGAYNIAGEGVVTAVDAARELGAIPLPVPAAAVQFGARALTSVPFLPPFAQWAEALTQPLIMDTTKAREELGWRPAYTALETLRATLAA